MAKFFRRGVSKVHFLPAIADPAAPTQIEIDGGTHLSPQLASITGFGIANQPIPTPNLEERFTPNIDGPNETTGNSSMNFWDDDTATTIRTALATGTEGYVLLMPYGTGTGKRAETWQVKTTGVNDVDYSTGNEAAQFQVGFVVVSEPEQDAALP